MNKTIALASAHSRLALGMVLSLMLSIVSNNAFADAQWRVPNNDSLLVMQLDSGQVIIELAPQFAPKHVANIKQLVSQRYFDDTSIIRSQDNYVVQWGDPNEDTDNAKSIGKAQERINTEFYRDNKELNYTSIESRDAYTKEVGFVDGFAVASDGHKAWLAHCYGVVGVSRGMEEDSGNGSGLYVVTGHAPRHLDLNVTLVGRVLKGMELLSSLPRGTGPLGFYETKEEQVSIRSISILNDNAMQLSVMRTDSQEFTQHVAKRTNRTEEWFLEPTGKVELCNVGVPLKSTQKK
jgi:peptidylprolyl isomerase